MNTTTFISEDYIKDNTPLNQNISASDIINNILPAQDLHLEPILGTNFYNELLVKYADQTLNSNEEILVGYIKPVVAYYSTAMALPFIQYQVKNKGVQEQFGDNSSSTDISNVKMLRNELENRAEFYHSRLISYLCDNADLFDGYVNNNTTDLSPTNKPPYDSGMTFYNY